MALRTQEGARGDSPVHGRSTRRVLLLLGVASLVAVAFWGADRVPADATRPLVLTGTPELKSLPSSRLRIGAFNIHGGKGTDGKRDLQRIAGCIDNAKLDFVGLSEVHGGFRSNQAVELGDRTQMAACFAPTERRFWHAHFGNGILTRVALPMLQRVPLTCTQGRKYRNAVLATIQLKGETVRVLSVHLDRQQDRERQLGDVIRLFLSLQEPAVLVGDLNTTAADPHLKRLLADGDVRDAITDATGKPAGNRIDWILTRGFTPVKAGTIDRGASDHPLVWAELRLNSNGIARVKNAPRPLVSEIRR